jgi:hypothetical protein
LWDSGEVIIFREKISGKNLWAYVPLNSSAFMEWIKKLLSNNYAN